MPGPTAVAAAPIHMPDLAIVAQDCFLPSDSTASTALMAKLLGSKSLFATDVNEKQAIEIVLAQEDVDEQEEAEEADLPLQLSMVEPAAALETQPSAVEPLAAAAEVETEVRAENRCCLENCDWIMPNLYLGGIEAAIDSRGLRGQGVEAVVCCNRELEFATSNFIQGIEYYRVDVEDMGREPIELFFPEASEFIHTQLLQERSVLVHCTAGVSRSASVLLAYLMEYGGYSLYDAFFLIHRHRPTITPNPGFMERLRDYEKEILGTATSSIDLRKYLEWFQAPERCSHPDLRPDSS